MRKWAFAGRIEDPMQEKRNRPGLARESRAEGLGGWNGSAGAQLWGSPQIAKPMGHAA